MLSRGLVLAFAWWAASGDVASIPDCASLELNGSARQHGSRSGETGLAAVHDTHGHGGEVAVVLGSAFPPL